jgi:hypothetical protein
MTLGACSTAKPPREAMAVSRAAVEQATGLAAAEAPTELANARIKLQRADDAMARKEYERARRFAEEAAADAALAEAKARDARATRALEEVQQSIRELRAQLSRN